MCLRRRADGGYREAGCVSAIEPMAAIGEARGVSATGEFKKRLSDYTIARRLVFGIYMFTRIDFFAGGSMIKLCRRSQHRD
jgi:hypothetical protein